MSNHVYNKNFNSSLLIVQAQEYHKVIMLLWVFDNQKIFKLLLIIYIPPEASRNLLYGVAPWAQSQVIQ
jgi:hypothetical protein